jgi:hypothetical protein
MESFNQIGPWIAAALLFGIVVFFGVFYITRLLRAQKTATSFSGNINTSENLGSVKTVISKEQRKKLKDEIVHDIVADITPVLEKRLEKAF